MLNRNEPPNPQGLVVVSYQKHGNSKGARRLHHKREQSRRRKLRAKGGQVEPFGYADTRGRDRKGLRIMSVTKGARDGAPRLTKAAGIDLMICSVDYQPLEPKD